ncbi:hypothetical protein D9M71_765850 [compost metagenome]
MLDNRYMLVGGCMVDGINFPSSHHIVQSDNVPYGSQDGDQMDLMGFARNIPLQFDLDII